MAETASLFEDYELQEFDENSEDIPEDQVGLPEEEKPAEETGVEASTEAELPKEGTEGAETEVPETVAQEADRRGISEEEIEELRRLKVDYRRQQEELQQQKLAEQQKIAAQQANDYRSQEINHIKQAQSGEEAVSRIIDTVDRRVGGIYNELLREVEGIKHYLTHETQMSSAAQQFRNQYPDAHPYEEYIQPLVKQGVPLEHAVDFVMGIAQAASGGKNPAAPASSQRPAKRQGVQLEVVESSGTPKKANPEDNWEKTSDSILNDLFDFDD